MAGIYCLTIYFIKDFSLSQDTLIRYKPGDKFPISNVWLGPLTILFNINLPVLSYNWITEFCENLTQETLREYIRNERRVELALEGHRYFDLKRWKIAHIKLPTMILPDGTPYLFEEYNYYLPIPQAEMDRNTELVQTDGY